MQEFTTFATRNTHLVKLLPSRLELHTEAYFLADSVPGTNLASQVNREIAHVHGQGDFSVHVTLAPADCMFSSSLPFVLPFGLDIYKTQARKSSRQAGASDMHSRARM